MFMLLSAVIAIIASIAAFISAKRWLAASRVVGMAGGVEPGDEIAAANWRQAGMLFGNIDSSALNAKAAWWAAVAAGLYGVSGLVAAVPVIAKWAMS
jgi:hypothetical protein